MTIPGNEDKVFSDIISSSTIVTVHSFLRKLSAGAMIAGLAAASHAQSPGERWLLRVEDLHHQARIEAKLRFTDDSNAKSCMGGIWKRIVVEERSTQDEKFFPLAAALAYQLDSGRLTLGRTTVCDGYLFLSGKSHPSEIQGHYNLVSLSGGEPLGYFSLSKIK